MKTNEEIFKILTEEGFSKGDVSVFIIILHLTLLNINMDSCHLIL